MHVEFNWNLKFIQYVMLLLTIDFMNYKKSKLNYLSLLPCTKAKNKYLPPIKLPLSYNFSVAKHQSELSLNEW